MVPLNVAVTSESRRETEVREVWKVDKVKQVWEGKEVNDSKSRNSYPRILTIASSYINSTVCDMP